MWALLLVLFVSSLWAFGWWLAKSNDAKQPLAWGFGLVLVGLTTVILVMPDTKRTDIATDQAVVLPIEPKPVAVISKIKPAKHLGLTYTEFAARFNQSMQEAELSFRIGEIDIDRTGLNHTFKYMLNDHIALVGAVSDDNHLVDITMIGQGKGTLESGADVMLVMMHLIYSTNPNMLKSDVGKVFSKIFQETEKRDEVGKPTATVDFNDIKYSFFQNKEIGTILAIERIGVGQ